MAAAVVSSRAAPLGRSHRWPEVPLLGDRVGAQPHRRHVGGRLSVGAYGGAIGRLSAYPEPGSYGAAARRGRTVGHDGGAGVRGRERRAPRARCGTCSGQMAEAKARRRQWCRRHRPRGSDQHRHRPDPDEGWATEVLHRAGLVGPLPRPGPASRDQARPRAERRETLRCWRGAQWPDGLSARGVPARQGSALVTCGAPACARRGRAGRPRWTRSSEPSPSRPSFRSASPWMRSRSRSPRCSGHLDEPGPAGAGPCPGEPSPGRADRHQEVPSAGGARPAAVATSFQARFVAAAHERRSPGLANHRPFNGRAASCPTTPSPPVCSTVCCPPPWSWSPRASRSAGVRPGTGTACRPTLVPAGTGRRHWPTGSSPISPRPASRPLVQTFELAKTRHAKRLCPQRRGRALPDRVPIERWSK